MRLLLMLGFVLSLVATAVAVGVGEAEAGGNTTQAELDDNRALWESQDIDDYSLITEAFCFCLLPGPVTVEVVAGEVVSVDPPDAAEFFAYTVEDLFGEIQQALDSGAVVLEVTYDAETGIPLSITIDVSFMIADEELAIEVLGTTFEPAPGPIPGPTGEVVVLVPGGQFVFWSYADATAASVFGALKIAWLFNADAVNWTSFIPELGVTDFPLTEGDVLWLVAFQAMMIEL